jgi:RNA polymerase sigma-70 factor, ECF subfamily
MTREAGDAILGPLVRESRGRLLACLAGRTGDIAAAEDALSDAIAAALVHWPVQGVPEKPEAWLLAAARRRLIDAHRRAKTREHHADALRQVIEDTQAPEESTIPDRRLELLFVCAHPAIDPASRTPLMLQAVLGLDAKTIAAAFLVAPAAMGQQLVRAKTKIRDAGIPFRLPEACEWAERLADVLDAVYAAFTTAWEDRDGRHSGLSEEAIWLGRLLVELIPDSAEARGLLALMLFSHARREARSGGGAFVPLDRQDTALWDEPMLAEANQQLHRASTARNPGRFQLEAAIQAVHADRRRSGRTDWQAICRLYEGLCAIWPGIGARIGRAVALGESGHPSAGLQLLDAISTEHCETHQPYWVARGHLLEILGQRQDAAASWRAALDCTAAPELRQMIEGRIGRLVPR